MQLAQVAILELFRGKAWGRFVMRASHNATSRYKASYNGAGWGKVLGQSVAENVVTRCWVTSGAVMGKVGYMWRRYELVRYKKRWGTGLELAWNFVWSFVGTIWGGSQRLEVVYKPTKS